MSRDIRSYFLPKASSKNDIKPAASNQGSTQKSQKKRTIILDSDSDEELSKPQAKKAKGTTVSKTASKENGKTSVKKDLKPINPEDIFGKQKVKRSTEKTVPEPKNKQVKEEIKDEDETFAAVLEQLDKQEKSSPLELVDAAASHKTKETKVSPSKVEKTTKKTKLNNTEPSATVPTKKVKTEEVKPTSSKEVKITKEHKTSTSHPKEAKPNKVPEEREKKDKSKKVSPSKTSPIITTDVRHVKEESIKKESMKKLDVSSASVEDSGADDSFTIDPLEKKRQHAIHYQKYLQRQGPRNPGAKEIPEGKPGCLSGKVFVITGVLESLEREETAALIQQYGGKVTGSISRNTSFVIVGEDPGPSKMEKATKLNIKQLTEDGLLELIASSPGKEDISTLDVKGKSKKSDKDESGKQSKYWKKESEKENKTNLVSEIKMEAPVETKIRLAPEKQSPSSSSTSSEKSESTSPEYKQSKAGSAELWVDKYKPTSLKQIIGQQGDRSNVKKLLKWLEKWHVNHAGKKKATRPSPWAKDDNGAFFKAALLSGPPGVGKTTTAHLVCKELGYDVVEFNASDTRSKKLLHEEVTELLSSKSLFGYFEGGAGKKTSIKHVLLMDEVDGMAGNEDRGGMQELIQLIKSSRVPVICMCNDRSHPKIRSLTNYCFDLSFSKPRIEQIRGAMMSICFKEGVKISGEALNDIINGANQDIRQVLHHLSLWSAKDKQLSAEQAKEDSQKSKKHIKLGPWDVVRKVFSADAHKSMSLRDKSDLFFHDYSLGPLFVQQNYVIANPHKAKGDKHKQLMLLSEAADNISMGNTVEQTIRSRNAWSLLPVQAMFSSVLPGEAMEGHLTAQINFPAWLGKNSRRNKFHRLVQELQVHMRLTTLASKQAINLDYLQHIRDRIAEPLITKGTDGVPDTLNILKTYSLLREDIDSIMELSLWPGQKDPMSLIDSKVKAALTRAYNKEGIMIPYSVASNIKKRVGGSIDELDPEQEEQMEEEEEQDDISSDAMIKAKKRPAASRNRVAGDSETKKRKGKDKEEKEKSGKQKNKKKQK